MLDDTRGTTEPRLAPVKNGWAAYGDGWAVHAPSREEAERKFREAERRNREIDERPFWFEQRQALEATAVRQRT